MIPATIKVRAPQKRQLLRGAEFFDESRIENRWHGEGNPIGQEVDHEE
jgi:hypothetical protein